MVLVTVGKIIQTKSVHVKSCAEEYLLRKQVKEIVRDSCADINQKLSQVIYSERDVCHLSHKR